MQCCPRSPVITRPDINSGTPLLEEEEEDEEEIALFRRNSSIRSIRAEPKLALNSPDSDQEKEGIFSTLKHSLYSHISSSSSSSSEDEADELASLTVVPDVETAGKPRSRSRSSSIIEMITTRSRALASRGRHDNHRNTEVEKGYYITDNFFKRVCCHFIPQPRDWNLDNSLDWCKCGLHSKDHTNDALTSNDGDDPEAVWNYLRHTVRAPTDAFGVVDFVDETLDTSTHYLRLDLETPVTKIINLLVDKWGLPIPHLIMSIFGESYRDLDLNLLKENAALFADLTSGLLKAAGTTAAWFTTTGLNCGVNKLVGRAVGNNRSFINAIPTIGFTPWGAVRDCEDLVDMEGSFPASYLTYVMSGEDSPSELALESNHTHFLLLDKGIRGSFYKTCVAKKRVEVELYMANSKNAQMVSIMIAGDLNSLKEARKRVEIKKPLIIMRGTGRMADIICLAFDGLQESQIRRIASLHDLQRTPSAQKLSLEATETVLSALRETYHSRKNQSFDQQMNDIRYLVNNQEYITICKCGTDEVDKIILSGLIRSMGAIQDQQSGLDNTRMAFHQLRLAIFWNRVDLAVEEIFRGLRFSDDLMDELLYLAMKMNRVDFVRKFINKGSSIGVFLTQPRFLELLNDIPKTSFLGRLLTKKRRRMQRLKPKCVSKKGFNKRQFTFKHFSRVIYEISDGVYQCTTSPKVICGRSCNTRFSVASIKSHFEDPEVLLVLLCVLDNRHQMAMLLWEHSKSPAMLALVVSHIYKWIADRETSYIEITPEMTPVLLQNADEFQSLAFRIVEEASKNYPAHWVDSLITHSYFNWGGKTLLQVADFTDASTFISHTAIQDYVTKQWMGKLDPDMTYKAIALSIFVPVFASFRKLTISEVHDKMISKETDEKERQRKAFVSKKEDETRAMLTKKTSNKKLNLAQKVYYFYSAPIVKFLIYLMTYFSIMLVYTLALLGQPSLVYIGAVQFNVYELVVYIWMFSIIPVEIRQVYHSCPSTIKGKIKNYLSNAYNRTDIYSMFFIFVALFFRLSPIYDGLEQGTAKGEQGTSKEEHPPPIIEEALYRIFFAFGFAALCFRMLQSMQISSQLGPKVLMMFSMISDLMFFLGLLVVVLLAYSVCTQSLINPTRSNFNFKTVFSLVWRPYLNMFGELDLDTLNGDISEGYCLLSREYNKSVQCDNAATDYDCEGDIFCTYNRYLVLVLLGVYMMVAAVMLLNLLVAVFTFTYDQINANSATIWSFQRYQLVDEFRERSCLPVPFNTIVLLGFFVRWVYRKICGKHSWKMMRTAQKNRHDHKQDRIALLEAECRRNLLEKLSKKTEITVVYEGVQECSSNMTHLSESFGGFQKSLQGILDQTVNKSTYRGGGPSLGTVSGIEVDGMVGTISPQYPDTSISRTLVPDNYRSWEVIYMDYSPASYTEPRSPDPEVCPELEYNSGERKSYCGVYEVREGVPLNPRGRTGLEGRGGLDRWGPNHLAVPVITRMREGQVEVLLYHDEEEVALPELNSTFTKTMVLPTQLLSIFRPEVTPDPEEDEENTTFRVFERGALLERGYLGSPYNTDHAWFEIVSYNYHDHDGELLGDLNITNYEWSSKLECSKKEHRFLVEKARTLRS